MTELVGANLAFVNKGGYLIDRFFERVMFPVHDLQGRSIAFGGRIMGQGEPKYLNTSETPIFHKSSNMFGIDVAKNAIVNSDEAIVVEGYTDVIAMHRAGIKNAVATPRHGAHGPACQAHQPLRLAYRLSLRR